MECRRRMAYWQNWSGKLSQKLEAVHFVRSVEDISAIIRELAPGERVRVAGAGHSHAPLVIGGERILDLGGFSGVKNTDVHHQRARISAGTPIYTLGQALHSSGLALRNQGDIDRQSLGGACATGTHGSGRALQNLSANIESVQLIDGEGRLRELSRDSLGDDFDAVKVGLGAFGVVTEIEMNCREAFKLREVSFQRTGDELVANLHQMMQTHERFEFFWQPRQDQGLVKTMAETDDAPEYPIAKEGERCGWNYEVLPNHRPHLHTEMEYSVAAADGPACFAEIRDLLMNTFTEVQWPVEYRTLARDDAWLSNAYERETVTISVHQDVRVDESDYYAACESIFKAYQGRPHWGKVHYLGGENLASLYPKWRDWWRLRDHLDPRGIFLNDFLARVRPKM